MSNKIKTVKTEYYRVPLEGNLVDALHGKHDFFELVIAKIQLEDGRNGSGYTYTGGFGGAAIAKIIENDLTSQLVGIEMTTPDKMNDYMNQHIHYVARGGIASFAISALDIAFWDIKLKTENLALKDLNGCGADRVRTYYGGIDLMYSEKELLKNIEKQLEAGHTAVKIKLGRENEEEDIQRVKAVRNLIGPEALFMVDANMVWSVPKAIRMAKRLEEYNIGWLEEPTNPDDYEGYAKIGQATTIPIAMGENLHTIYEHELAMKIGRISCPIPDCSNVCGITGFLKVAKLAEEYSVKVHSHGMQELHANVLGALQNRGYVEFHSFPIYKYTVNPLCVKNGYLETCKNPGMGVEFDYEKLKAYRVK